MIYTARHFTFEHYTCSVSTLHITQHITCEHYSVSTLSGEYNNQTPVNLRRPPLCKEGSMRIIETELIWAVLLFNYHYIVTFKHGITFDFVFIV